MSPFVHFAAAFAAKAAAPKAPLWVLLAASEVPDLLWGILSAAGIERQAVTEIDLSRGMTVLSPGYLPWSHGLLMTVVWSLAAAGLAYLAYRDRRACAAVGLVVFSHWVLDFVVHLPDLPLALGGSPEVGLGLWGSGPGFGLALVLEFALLAAGVAFYLRARKAGAQPARA